MTKQRMNTGFQIEVILGITDSVEAVYQYVIWYQVENNLTPIFICEGKSLYSTSNAARQAAKEWIIETCNNTIAHIGDI
jgi:hypothetical protein